MDSKDTWPVAWAAGFLYDNNFQTVFISQDKYGKIEKSYY